MTVIKVTVHDKVTLDALKAARREINREVREGLKEVAQEVGLPAVRREAPDHLASGFVAGATARVAYVAARGKLKRQIGLLNYGGVRRDTIRGKDRPLATPHGPRWAVKGPRTYRAGKFMERGLEESLPRARPRLEAAAVRPYERRLGVTAE